jgi:cytochrome b561
MTIVETPARFALLSRILHWLMAAMLLAMLFIGVTMVASLGNYHRLVAIHRPLGILILIMAAVRLINRICTKPPAFPATMSPQERIIASASERLLYMLMFALPLVGWGMLSAGHYPIVMFGPVHLPAILPADPALYAVLRTTHTLLAYLLFLTFIAHLNAVLFHTLIIRDRLLDRMALWPAHFLQKKKLNGLKSVSPPMKTQNMITDPSSGIVKFTSPWPYHETVERIKAALLAKKIKLFASIDQSAEAAAVGLNLRPTTVLIFGDPAKGTPLMEAYPSIAIDLPLKALIWEAGASEVYVGLTSPDFLQQRHGLPYAPFAEVVRLFDALINAADKP